MSVTDINPELPSEPDTVKVPWRPDNYDELELYRSLVEESPVAAGLYYSRNLNIAIANNVILNIWGKDKSVMGMPLAEAVPELEGQPFLAILDSIFDSGKTYNFTEMPAELPMGGVMGTYYFDFTYKPMFDENGKVYAILNKAVDVTDRVKAKRLHEASEKRFRLVTEQSPMAIALLKGREMVIELGNDKIFELWGKPSSVTGLPLAEALPELKGQPFLQILDKVFTTGETYNGYDVLAKLNYGGELKDVYFDFTYTAVRDAEGRINGVMVMANEVTERIISTRKLAESEAKFRTVMNVAPAAMALFMGRDLKIEMPNQAFKDVIGKGDDIEGKNLGELLPELESQAFLKILDDIFISGKPYHMYGAPVTFLREDGPQIEYFNIIFTPLFDENNEVYAILDISVKVTEAIHNQQAIAEAEAALRGAIELAELATWSLNPVTGIVTYSERLQQWFGFDTSNELPENVFKAVHPADRTRIQKAIQKALDTDGDGIYDEEYTVINLKTGRERILHAQAKAFLDAEGKPYLLAGTAQDITNQRKIQTALQHEVAERTMQLELANKGLEEANRQLVTSNEELAQYAYVASHDLQEPLRKITMFSNLLHERDVDNVHTALIDKIVNASKRMSSLIKDLLEFSRLLNTDARFTETDITSIVKAIRDDFELLIEEKQAVIEVNNLPVLEAVPLQMNQLFYNLISNALKFTPTGRKPLVKITCDIALPQQVNMHVNNPQNVQYYIVSVQDNGIGIDEQYSKQIFDVFKRLHGRDEYSGSGIGLAICRRIVTNHHGAIYVESTVGEGTTFRILLPKKQQS